MKKSLLLIGSVLMSMASFAQSFTAEWPKPDAPEFRSFAVEDTIYLWNVGAGGFYTNYRGDAPSYPAPYYGTRASVCDTVGAKVIFTRTNPAGTDETGNFETASENTYLLVSYVSKFSEFRCTFTDGWSGTWTDNNANANRYFKFSASGNYIKIEPDVELCQYTNSAEGQYFGIRANDADKIVYLYDIDTEGAISAEETFYDEWAAVSPEAYEKYYAFVTSEEGQTMMACYAAAQTLKARILEAQSKGISAANLADEYAVYNNLNSTVEELNAAAAAAYDKGRWVEIAEYFEGITPGEKNDVSGVFVNNDFSAGNANGWDITYTGNSTEATNIGYQGATYTNGEVTISGFIEAWKDANSPNYLGDGSVTQTIPGLPAGKYMLAVDVIANNQGRIQDTSNPDGLPDDVQLFAKASLDGKEYFTPMATKNGAPEHFEFTFVHTGGSMTLGLRVIGSADAKMPANWIAMDNLQLFYYGEVTEDPDKIILDAAIEKAEEAYPVDDLDNIIAYKADKDAYAAVINEAKAATADYESYTTKVSEALATLKTSIAAYEKLIALVDDEGEWQNKVALFGELGMEGNELVGAWCDFVQGTTSEGYPEITPDVALEEMNLPTADIDAYIETVDKKFQEAFAAAMEPGMDVSALLKNASFKEGFTGWTYKAGTFGGLKDYPCVEVFDNVVEVSQTITGIPDGVYSLTCQAFWRPGAHGSYDGSEQSNVNLFMNNYQTPVQNIASDVMPEEDAVDYENCFLSGGNPTEDFYSTGGTTNKDLLFDNGEVTGYVPDGMSGASYAFRAGRYEQTAKGLIEGGTMTIGLTSNGEKVHWVLWSAFKLTYIGEDVDAVIGMLQAKIDDLNAYLEVNANDMTGFAVNEASGVLEDAEAAIESEDIETLKASMEKVTAALAAAQENVAAVAAYSEATENFATAAESYYEGATSAAQAAWDAMNDEIDGYDITDYSTEEVKELTENINAVIGALRVPDYTGASKENPVDMTRVIVNNGFEEGNLNGWTNSGTIDGQAQNNTSFDNKQGTYYAEKWHVNGTVDINQSLAYLPAGAYELKAYVYSSASDCYLYVNDTETNVTTSQLYTISFKLSEPTNVAKIGVKWSDAGSQWTCLDEFTLTYFGKAVITVDDITKLIERYLNGEEGVNIQTVTELIDEYLNQ